MDPDTEPFQGLWIFLGLILAMILRILPLPPALLILNPDWVALVLLLSTLSMPERLGIFRAWLIGLCVDTLTARLLGQHALAYSVMAYLSLRGRSSLIVLRKPVQMLWILSLLLLGQALILWSGTSALSPEFEISYWYPSLTGTLIWPLLIALREQIPPARGAS